MAFDDPFDPRSAVGARCSRGAYNAQAEHDAQTAAEAARARDAAEWITAQMKRLGERDGRSVTQAACLAPQPREAMAEPGITSPKTACSIHTIMGRSFDPEKADAHAKRVAICRSA